MEITTFRVPGKRTESKYSKTIEEDLAGRDFTINALAYNLINNELVDPYDGLADLAAKKLKAVGRAKERFSEDPLRIMRMIRIAAEYDLEIDPETFKAAKESVKEINSVSVERVRDELNRILLSSKVKVAFHQMYDLGLLHEIIPEMLVSYGFEQNEYHTEDVFNHILSVVEQSVPQLKVRLAALFHDFGKPASFLVGDDGRRHFYSHELISANLAEQVMKRLKYPKKLTQSVALLAKAHMRPLKCGPAAVRRVLRDLGEGYEDWYKLKLADITPLDDIEELKLEREAFLKMVEEEKVRQASPIYGKMAINGDDLKTLGFQEGKLIGSTLKKLDEVLIENPELNDKEKLINLIKSWENQ